jgi:hypothetical protein
LATYLNGVSDELLGTYCANYLYHCVAFMYALNVEGSASGAKNACVCSSVPVKQAGNGVLGVQTS